MPRKGNYRTVWSPEVLDEYLKRIAIDGMSARGVGKMKDMPSYESFHMLKSQVKCLRPCNLASVTKTGSFTSH